MGRDPPPVLPGRLAAEEAPAEEAAEVWVRWAVLRLALLLMVLPLLLPRRRRPWVLRLWQRVLWRLLLGLLLGLLLWLLQAVVRRPKEDRGNVAAGDLGEGWQFHLSFFFKQKTAYEISACLVGSEMCIRDRSRGFLEAVATF